MAVFTAAVASCNKYTCSQSIDSSSTFDFFWKRQQ